MIQWTNWHFHLSHILFLSYLINNKYQISNRYGCKYGTFQQIIIDQWLFFNYNFLCRHHHILDRGYTRKDSDLDSEFIIKQIRTERSKHLRLAKSVQHRMVEKGQSMKIRGLECKLLWRSLFYNYKWIQRKTKTGVRYEAETFVSRSWMDGDFIHGTEIEVRFMLGGDMM